MLEFSAAKVRACQALEGCIVHGGDLANQNPGRFPINLARTAGDEASPPPVPAIPAGNPATMPGKRIEAPLSLTQAKPHLQVAHTFSPPAMREQTILRRELSSC